MVASDELSGRVSVLESAVKSLAAMEFGDIDGHPFHGNQYQAGGGKMEYEKKTVNSLQPGDVVDFDAHKGVHSYWSGQDGVAVLEQERAVGKHRVVAVEKTQADRSRRMGQRGGTDTQVTYENGRSTTHSQTAKFTVMKSP